jgi:HSP20 family protein
MTFKSKKSLMQPVQGSPLAESGNLLLHENDLLDSFRFGLWTPQVDICQTESMILVRAELPGVDSSDISISFQGDFLHLQGIKREPPQSCKLLCYFCLERRYGRFDRKIGIDWIVNPRKAHAYLDKGILTIELPKLADRRGKAVKIEIEKK